MLQTSRLILRPLAAVVVVLGLTVGSSWAYDGNAPSPEKEKELIAILKSEAPAADKALACKNLAVHGSNEAVPELAKLLENPELASWARIPLEAIPGSVANEALRSAVGKLKGELLVGTINSIGVRRDSEAVEILAAKLTDADEEIGSASAVALGQIGNPAAAKTLRGALKIASPKVRSAVAEGCVLCAERLVENGDAAGAVEIYDEVRKSEVSKPRILEATRGAILAHKPEEGIALLLEQFRSTDRGLFRLALSTAREFPGKEIDAALARELATAKPEQAALLVSAMADRKESVVLPAVLKAAAEGPRLVRIAALQAIGRVGNGTCLSTLLEIALDKDLELASLSRQAISDLSGESVDREIVAGLSKAEGKTYQLLLELVGQRRINAVAELLKAANHSDKAVRSAALTSLGATVTPEHLKDLIQHVVKPKNSDDAQVAEVALKTACIRMPDRDVCAAELGSALANASGGTKLTLLQILGDVQGTKALQTLALAAKSDDPAVQDTSSKLLGEWMTIDAAPVLLDLSKTARGEKYQVRALRGYIRIARVFIMEPAQRLEMCESALAAAKQSAEKKLVLEIARRYPSLDMLKLAVKTGQEADLKADARPVALEIAQKMGLNPEVLELLGKLGLEKVKVEIVKAEYGAGSNQRDVTEILKRQVKELPIILLPKSSYSTSFGGDPAPGATKQLKVQYKLNDKAGEATFAENAVIVLPQPK